MRVLRNIERIAIQAPRTREFVNLLIACGKFESPVDDRIETEARLEFAARFRPASFLAELARLAGQSGCALVRVSGLGVCSSHHGRHQRNTKPSAYNPASHQI